MIQYKKLNCNLGNCNFSQFDQQYKSNLNTFNNNYGIRKDVGQSCKDNADCLSAICVANPSGRGSVCVANSSIRKSVGESCNNDSNCYSGICVAKPGGLGNICVANNKGYNQGLGKNCTRDIDCISTNCGKNGKCLL